MQSQNIWTQTFLLTHDSQHVQIQQIAGLYFKQFWKRWLKVCFHINSPVETCAFYGNAHLVKAEKSKKFFSWEKQKQNHKTKENMPKNNKKNHKQNRIVVSNS